MASAYLYKNQGTATNAKKFTYSVWLKRSKIGNNDGSSTMRFYQGFETSNNRFYALFTDEDKLWIYAVTGGTIQIYWVSNRRFRDTNSWYHIVFKGDTTQSAQADRLRVYVNGVEETDFTKNNNISQNVDWGNLIAHTNNDLTISGTESQSQMFDGLMSHIHFIDGTAYDASAFGSFDNDTGEWSINTSPSVTYGNTGYFILKDDNSHLDRSGNNNHFTIGGTLTKTSDCPDNIFCTINPLWKHNVSSQNNVVLVQGNTTWYPSSATNNHSWGRSTLGWTSGKYYFEFKIEEVNTGQASGVWLVPTDYPSNSSPQSGTDICYGWQVQYSSSNANFYTTNGGSSVSTITSSLGANPIIMMAIDADNKKMWIGHNGTWWNNNNASTTLNTSYPDHTWTIGTYGDMYQLAFQAYYSSANYNNARANFGNGYFGTTAVSSAGTNASGNGIFEYDVPNGFTALSTKGLNL